MSNILNRRYDPHDDSPLNLRVEAVAEALYEYDLGKMRFGDIAIIAVDAADAAVDLGAAANVLRVYRSDKEMGSARLTELIVDAALGRRGE